MKKVKSNWTSLDKHKLDPLGCTKEKYLEHYIFYYYYYNSFTNERVNQRVLCGVIWLKKIK